MKTLSVQRNKNSYLLSVLNENRLFILFSFFSCTLPIVYCLLASLIKPNGSQAVMALGHVMPFTLAFMQISFSISMIIFAKLSELRKVRIATDGTNTVISSTIWMSIFIGFICTIFYVPSSFLYMYYSNNKPNTQAMLWYGLDFTWITIPFILLFPLFVVSLFIIRRKNTLSALMLLIFSFVIEFTLSFLFAFALELKVLGIGLGLTIGLIVSICINFVYVNLFFPFTLYSPLEMKEFNVLISKVVMKESLTSISMSLFKGVAIICLSFVIPNTISGFVPLPYQMSRVIWFNFMYFIPFIGIGVGEGIRYHYLSRHSKYSDHSCYLNHRWKNDFKIIYATLGFTILIAIGSIFIVKPLVNAYVVNDTNLFENGKMPEIAGWGVPTIPPKHIFDFNKLKDLNLTPFPELDKLTGKPLDDMFIKIKNLKKIKNWITINAENNKVALGSLWNEFNELSVWYEWLTQTNSKGETIIQFIERKNGFENGWFWKEIKHLIDTKQPSPKLIDALKGPLSYFEYLWLYSHTSSIVTDSFLLLRPIINYDNILNNGIYHALTNYSLNEVLTSLFLKINIFDAKAMIYVSIYGVFCSLWSILIQLNQRNEKKGMPYWMLSLIYAVCIGFLVTFGVLFGVTFKEELGNNNPFMYLDAWTFPLIVISFFVIVVLSIKCYKGYRKVKKEREMVIKNNVRVH